MTDSYRWRLEDASGQALPDRPEQSVPFPTQADAEAWFAESWEDLAGAGVAQVSLLRESEVVYGPMPLSPE
ncbi:hypothetical protein O9K63_03620 [Janibacter cremeus]|uniref:hypothetical protein n=1 Tax=Janibacter cremeus TaxID=1285192 RepID=UPI0023F7EC4D|nr:hypothetical protein [Janibacter cremeus]WEV78898.1 hypothetical protein O9K63_03620 [Janibacter cremeus]